MQHFTRWTTHVGMGALSLLAVVIANAEEVQLVNGDRITGSVVSLTAKSLTLKSEVLGEIVIPRDKVGAIYLGDVKPPAQTAPAVRQQPQPAAKSPVTTG